MDYYKYLSYTTGFFFKPGDTINQLFFGFKEKLFKFGLLTSILANISMIMSGLLLNPFQMSVSGTFVIVHLVVALLMYYIVFFVSISVIYMIMHFVAGEIKVQEFVGLYLTTDFPYFITLPLALIFINLPAEVNFIYNILTFAIFVLVVILRIKAISVATRIRDLKSFGILLIPIGLMILLGLASFLYLSSVILNLLT